MSPPTRRTGPRPEAGPTTITPASVADRADTARRRRVEVDSGRRSVTEDPAAACTISVTPRCQQCGARLIRKLPRGKYFGGGTWTQQYRKGARYCSNACRQKAYRQRGGAS